MWAAVLMRDDLHHAARQWRAHLLRAAASFNIGSDDAEEPTEQAGGGLVEHADATEIIEPNLGGCVHTCIRLPR